MVQDIFRQDAHRADRDVRQAGFLVLRETAMPSVLIETGYLSNKSEAAYLMTEKGRETIASSIFRSLKNYKSKFESRLNIVTADINGKPHEINYKEFNTKILPAKTHEKKDLIPHKKEDKPEAAKPEVVQSNKNSVSENISDEYTFAIQIAASKIKLPLTNKIFKGIENIQEIQVGDYYKYFCSESKFLADANQNLLLIHEKLPDAFIVGLKNGQPISYQEAINHK
jgi:N-acetylmuramoyl-L-alanine amidase